MSRGIGRSGELACLLTIFEAMMDTATNSFARRARLSSAYIVVAIAVTLAAAAAILSSPGQPTLKDSKVGNPVSASHSGD